MGDNENPLSFGRMSQEYSDRNLCNWQSQIAEYQIHSEGRTGELPILERVLVAFWTDI